MPGYDGTGPDGRGRIGRGLGPCAEGEAALGRGFSFFRRGRRGGGRGYRWFSTRFFEGKTNLEAEKTWLENRLKTIHQQINQDKA